MAFFRRIQKKINDLWYPQSVTWANVIRLIDELNENLAESAKEFHTDHIKFASDIDEVSKLIEEGNVVACLLYTSILQIKQPESISILLKSIKGHKLQLNFPEA